MGSRLFHTEVAGTRYLHTFEVHNIFIVELNDLVINSGENFNILTIINPYENDCIGDIRLDQVCLLVNVGDYFLKLLKLSNTSYKELSTDGMAITQLAQPTYDNLPDYNISKGKDKISSILASLK